MTRRRRPSAALAVRYLKEIVKEWPKSDEAKTARDLLKKLDK